MSFSIRKIEFRRLFLAARLRKSGPFSLHSALISELAGFIIQLDASMASNPPQQQLSVELAVRLDCDCRAGLR